MNEDEKEETGLLSESDKEEPLKEEDADETGSLSTSGKKEPPITAPPIVQGRIGRIIDGKYEIIQEIGRGGMSVVYLAMDKRLNKCWAIKEIRRRGVSRNDEIVFNCLFAEANFMKRLDYPVFPRIVDIIDNGQAIYIVMDYVEGNSLDQIIELEGPQSEDTVIHWSIQICGALQYLHSQKPYPIVYRDMKPSNLILKPEGEYGFIKIIDFGIAREYKPDQMDTTILGTKGYASPEQYTGHTDPRSDIYSLGMTMHCLLTGRDPRRSDGAPDPVRHYNPELSEAIELIIEKCIQFDPEKRYQNCEELLQDLNDPSRLTCGFMVRQRRLLQEYSRKIFRRGSKKQYGETSIIESPLLPWELGPKQEPLSAEEIDYNAMIVVRNSID